MAYTPINWQTGQTITAEKLNKMDNGWGVGSTQLFSETVTTTDTGQGFSVGTLAYSTPITAESITVTLNSTDYVCPKIVLGEDAAYGGITGSGDPDFTDYPFFISSLGSGQNDFVTQTANTYTVIAKAASVEVSDQFSSAVGRSIAVPTFSEDINTGDYVCDLSFDEVREAVAAGRCFFAYVNDEPFVLDSFSSYGISFYKVNVSGSEVVKRSLDFYPDSISLIYYTYPE